MQGRRWRKKNKEKEKEKGKVEEKKFQVNGSLVEELLYLKIFLFVFVIFCTFVAVVLFIYFLLLLFQFISILCALPCIIPGYMKAQKKHLDKHT